MTGKSASRGRSTSTGESGESMYRQLGRTGECVSAIGLGGFHVGAPKLSDAESIRLIRAAVDGASPSWTIAGTITRAKAKFEWVRRSRTAIAKKCFS
jgi:hypothetical protein